MTQPSKFSAQSLKEGDRVSFCISGSHNFYICALTAAHGRVATVTEKAVKIDLHDINGVKGPSIWLPKRALVKGVYHKESSSSSFWLAHWFNPDSRQWDAIERVQHTLLASC